MIVEDIQAVHGRDRLDASDKQTKDMVATVLSAYRSIIGDLTYVSMPISSGRLCYDIATAEGVTADELKTRDANQFFLDVIKPNIDRGTSIAHSLTGSHVGRPTIVPAVFQAKAKWSQDEYMAMWLAMIEQKVTTIVLTDDWEYSNGGAEEYLYGLQMQAGYKSRTNVQILDQRGAPLKISKALELIASALDDLHTRSTPQRSETLAQVFFDTVVLYQVAHTLGVHSDLPHANPVTYDCDGSMVRSLYKEAAPLLREYGLTSSSPRSINCVKGILRTWETEPESVILKLI